MSSLPTVAELDNVLFRLAMVKDGAMSGVVRKLLPRLLAQLTPRAFSDVAVRTRLVQILTHLQKRLSADTSLQLPVREILELFTGQPCDQVPPGAAGGAHLAETDSTEESSLSNDDDGEEEDEEEEREIDEDVGSSADGNGCPAKSSARCHNRPRSGCPSA